MSTIALALNYDERVIRRYYLHEEVVIPHNEKITLKWSESPDPNVAKTTETISKVPFGTYKLYVTLGGDLNNAFDIERPMEPTGYMGDFKDALVSPHLVRFESTVLFTSETVLTIGIHAHGGSVTIEKAYVSIVCVD